MYLPEDQFQKVPTRIQEPGHLKTDLKKYFVLSHLFFTLAFLAFAINSKVISSTINSNKYQIYLRTGVLIAQEKVPVLPKNMNHLNSSLPFGIIDKNLLIIKQVYKIRGKEKKLTLCSETKLKSL